MCRFRETGAATGLFIRVYGGTFNPCSIRRPSPSTATHRDHVTRSHGGLATEGRCAGPREQVEPEPIRLLDVWCIAGRGAIANTGCARQADRAAGKSQI